MRKRISLLVFAGLACMALLVWNHQQTNRLESELARLERIASNEDGILGPEDYVWSVTDMGETASISILAPKEAQGKPLPAFPPLVGDSRFTIPDSIRYVQWTREEKENLDRFLAAAKSSGDEFPFEQIVVLRWDGERWYFRDKDGRPGIAQTIDGKTYDFTYGVN